MRHATVFVLASLAAAFALSACHFRVPPKYDNKPVAAASAPAAPVEHKQ